MNMLRTHHPTLYKQLESVDFRDATYRIEVTKSGAPNLCIMTELNKETYYYSKYNPDHETERWVESIITKISDKSDVLIYGIGLGYHVDKLLQACPNIKLYLYEPDEQTLLKAMETRDLACCFGHPNVKSISVGRDRAAYEELFFWLYTYTTKEMATLVLPIYSKLCREHVSEFMEHAQQSIMNYASSVQMNIHLGNQWLENIFRNMEKNISTRSIRGMKGTMSGLPAVIVGAGPSLEADIETLKNLTPHALIIAAGSSIQSLLHYGIKPHLIVSMDGADSNLNVFQSLNTDSIPFLYIPQIHYQIIKTKQENLVHAFFKHDEITNYLMGPFNEEDPVFFGTHSVTGTAIQAAIYFGCKQIVLAGQDLSYPGERVYADGTKHVDESYSEYVLDTATEMVENVHGCYNRTTVKMKMTLHDIENLLEFYPNVEFINTTKSGAKINHTTWISMQEVCHRFKALTVPENIIKQAIRSHLFTYDDERVAQVTKKMGQIPDQLNEIMGKLDWINKRIGKLPELSRLKPRQCIKLISDIEVQWAGVVQNVIFNAILVSAMKNEISHFDRYLPQVVQETNLIRKSDLLIKVLGTLVTQMLNKLPKLKSLSEETYNHIREIKFLSE